MHRSYNPATNPATNPSSRQPSHPAHGPITQRRTVDRRRSSVLAAALVSVVIAASASMTSPLAAAGADAIEGSDPGEFTVTVDGSISSASGAKFSDSIITTIVGPHGTATDFVSGRLLISTGNPEEAAAIAERIGGKAHIAADPSEAIGALDPGDRKLAEQLDPTWIVDFVPDPSLAKSGAELIARSAGDVARGDYRFSSPDGLATMAQAASLRLDGLAVELDFVLAPDTFRNLVTTESPTQPGLMGTNSSTWAHLTEIKVPGAWNILARAGLLNAGSVRVAVLDGGFGFNDADRAPGGFADPSMPNSVPCGGGSSCPFHGANVASTLMAVPDNSFGAAGPGGPVATPILIDRGAVVSDVLAGYFRAVGAGARIVNMSFGADLPAVAAVFTGAVDATFSAMRLAGVMNVAAAGNSSIDIDRTDCFITCWEAVTVLPCEALGVTCVGGTNGAGSPHSGSNWGSGGLSPSQSVDLWAAFVTLAGPDPSAPANVTRFVRGTSFASPLVAGVAALARTASPGATVGDVEATLRGTAQAGGCSASGRCASAIVDAASAVSALLGNVPPDLTITPAGPVSTPRGVAVTFAANAIDPDGTTPTVSWFVDGVFVTQGPTFQPNRYLTFGSHQVTASAFDGRWSVPDSTGGRQLVIYNTAPTTVITQPANGAVLQEFGGSCGRWFVCLQPSMVAQTTDVNEPGGIASSAGRWEIDGLVVATGHLAPLPLLAAGTHTIKFVVSDPQGLTASHQITIEVTPRFFRVPLQP